ASIVGYPEDGPWADRAGHDLNFSAVTGCASLFNEMPALPLADLFAAYQAALSLASAIAGVARGATAGTRTVVSMSETLKDVQGGLIEEFRMSGTPPKPESTLFSGRFPCYRIYHSKDGRRIAVGAIEHKFWEKVCSILKVPEVLDAGFANGEKGQQTISQVQAVFEEHDWEHWAPLFDGADCCVEPVLNYQEVYGL
ncbi:CoA transferase, partial [Bdellovibrionota bacterium FG-2]